MIKNLQSQKGLLFGVSNVTEPAKEESSYRMIFCRILKRDEAAFLDAL